METLRRRIPFKFKDDEDQNTYGILDEQEQDALIEDLRKENEMVNRWCYLALKIIVGLSCILQLATFSHNPLLALFPMSSREPSIPIPVIFLILSLFIHLNLALFIFAEEVRVLLQLNGPLNPLSFQLLYLLSAVTPTVSLFFRKPWQTTVWWCITLLMVFIVQAITNAIQQSIQTIADLEAMKYKAPGA